VGPFQVNAWDNFFDLLMCPDVLYFMASWNPQAFDIEGPVLSCESHLNS
jgi:hypothetical protein